MLPMSKTLTIVLNHNLPDYTNWVYYSLKKFLNENMDLIIMDNGSRPELVPKMATVRLKKNIYWGGALNVAFKMVLENRDYDSLLFLNNDIDFTADIFVSFMRDAMFRYDLALASPCISGRPQPWRQMQNWGSAEPRIVNWIDLQSPIFHRKLIEAIGQFPEELQIGWGQELICSDVCRDHDWKTAVFDNLSIVHFGKQTLLQNKLYITSEDEQQSDETVPWEEFKALAMKTRDAWFEAHPLKHDSIAQQIDYGHKYTWTPVNKPASFLSRLLGRR